MACKNFHIATKRLLVVILTSLNLATLSCDSKIVVNYTKAFDQSDIYKRHHNLLLSWNLKDNVPSLPDNDRATYEFLNMQAQNSDDMGLLGKYLDFVNSISPCFLLKAGKCILNLDRNLTYEEERYENILSNLEDLPPEEEDFKNQCLDKLLREKRWSLTAPVRDNLSRTAFSSTAAILTKLAGAGKYATSIGALSISNDITSVSKAIIKLLRQEVAASELDALEVQYAMNRVFIPNELWEPIEQKFSMARNNKHAAKECMDFIQFSLGLTVYKPKVKITTQLTPDSINQELDKRIYEFFKDYDTNYFDLELYELRIAIHNFIKVLIEDKDYSQPKYIHFHGIGGIGKTHFVRKLSEWINELLPDAVNFEDFRVDNVQDLHGNSKTPGILLKVLRGQLQSCKRGSVVFIDEASWLNGRISSAAKSVFNGDLTRISTDYFGDTTVEFELQPIIIFVASNEKAISDEALQSRFVDIEFPLPTKDSLVKNATQKLLKSEIYKVAQNNGHATSVLKIVSEAVRKESRFRTFRNVNNLIEPYAMQQLEKKPPKPPLPPRIKF